MQTQLMIGLRVTRTMLEQNWNDKIRSLPGSHILQTREWGEIKSVYGWQVLSRTWEDEAGLTIAAAQILRKRITLAGIAIPYSIMYIPRGPMLDWSNAALVKRVLEDLKEMAKKENAIQLKIDAEYVFGRGTNGNSREDVQNEPVEQELTRLGWRYSSEQIQFKNTVWLALDGDEEALLARMKQKTRYNIRLAQKKGVTVRQLGRMHSHLCIECMLPPRCAMDLPSETKNTISLFGKNLWIVEWHMLYWLKWKGSQWLG